MERSAYAVEYISDHNLYQFAVKTTDTYTTSSETTTDIKWNIYTVDSSGLLSTTPNVYKGISKHEAAFNQDMNNDGAIGFSADSLISFATDTVGAILKRDGENNLYIDSLGNGQNLINIVDGNGDQIALGKLIRGKTLTIHRKLLQ